MPDAINIKQVKQLCPHDEEGRQHGCEEFVADNGNHIANIFVHGRSWASVTTSPTGEPISVSATNWITGHQISIMFDKNWTPRHIQNSQLEGEFNDGMLLFRREGPQYTFDADGKPTSCWNCSKDVNTMTYSPKGDPLAESWRSFCKEVTQVCSLMEWRDARQSHNLITDLVKGVGVPHALRKFEEPQQPKWQDRACRMGSVRGYQDGR